MCINRTLKKRNRLSTNACNLNHSELYAYLTNSTHFLLAFLLVNTMKGMLNRDKWYSIMPGIDIAHRNSLKTCAKWVNDYWQHDLARRTVITRCLEWTIMRYRDKQNIWCVIWLLSGWDVMKPSVYCDLWVHWLILSMHTSEVLPGHLTHDNCR